MQLSETVKLYLDKEQRALVYNTMKEYIRTVNGLVSFAVSGNDMTGMTSKDVSAALPSALKNQCIRDARSILRKHKRESKRVSAKNEMLEKQGSTERIKEPKVPVLKKLCCYINNQNYRIKDGKLQFPVIVKGRSGRLSVRTELTERQKDIFDSAKFGTMRIVVKNGKIVAQIVYEKTEAETKTDGNTMGIDLGIKCPAVSYTSDGSVRFHGNGRKNRYMRRHYASMRKRLQKEKHIDAVKRIRDKEQRIMKDIDHKISRDIIETARAHNVKVIKMERLANIRSATRTSRKNNHSLHSWSFYRLAQFIEYKAGLAGITVEYVDPKYTSQTCPVCGKINHAKDREYVCECGYHIHRDILGAINICDSTEYVGDRDIRHTA